jgi:DNA-binding NarL/FixJ family response regulator
MDAEERDLILTRYRGHAARFEAAAAAGRRSAVQAESPPRRLAEPGHELSGRELEVLQLVSDGLLNREISIRLCVSEETIKSHVGHLLAKLPARSRTHAVAVGFRRGLID